MFGRISVLSRMSAVNDGKVTSMFQLTGHNKLDDKKVLSALFINSYVLMMDKTGFVLKPWLLSDV